MIKHILWAFAAVFLLVSPALAVPAVQTPPSAPIDPRYQTPTTTVREVSSRTHIHGYVSNGYTSSKFVFWDSLPVPVSALQIAECNWYVNTSASGVEAAPGAASTVAYRIVYPNGTYTNITWGGNATGTIADGATTLSDLTALGFTIPAYTKFKIVKYKANATNMVNDNWSNAYDRAQGDCFQFNGANDNTCTDSGNGVYADYPCGILAQSNLPVRMGLGTSLVVGINDMGGDPSGAQGFFGRPLAKAGVYFNMGIGGDRASWFINSHAKRVALIATVGVDQGVDEYGANDFFSGGATSANLLAFRETIRGYFSFPMFDTTITPFTTSTDNWKTAANQTIQNTTNNTQRTTYNTSLRTTPPAASPGVIDVASCFETDTAHETQPVLNGGVFLPGLMDSTGGGIHPSTAGYASACLQNLIQGMITKIAPLSANDNLPWWEVDQMASA